MTTRTARRCAACLFLALSPATALAAGGVQVEASDAGASIFIDGADTGMETPGTIMGLSDGRHVVTVRNGCYVGEAVVEITPMSVVPVTVELEPGEGSIVVQPVPVDAKVELDGKPLKGGAGKEHVVACGPHTIQASMDGYLPTMITVDVEAGQDVVLPVELEPLGKGGLRVDVAPETAEVFLDGKSLGTGDQEIHGVVAGPHVLTASLAGFAPGEQQFILESGETLELALTLEPGGAELAGGSTLPPPRDKPPREARGFPTKPVGYGMIGLGLVSSAVSISQWTQGRSAYAEYLDRAAEVNAGERPPEYASDYHDKEVKKYRGPIYGASTAGLLLVGGGAVLVFAF